MGYRLVQSIEGDDFLAAGFGDLLLIGKGIARRCADQKKSETGDYEEDGDGEKKASDEKAKHSGIR